jgi:hypothetical protein
VELMSHQHYIPEFGMRGALSPRPYGAVLLNEVTFTVEGFASLLYSGV